MQGFLEIVAKNFVNWKELNANKTHQYGRKDLAYVATDSVGYHLDFRPFNGPWLIFNRHCANYRESYQPSNSSFV